MRLTTARYYTPSGRSIQLLGIEPDILVQPAKVEEVAQSGYLREADLRGALENDTVKEEKNVKNDKKAKSNEENVTDEEEGGAKKDGKKPVDYQMERAIDLIHGLRLFGMKGAAIQEARK